MKKVTKRCVYLGASALVLAICSLLCLCFPIVMFDLSSATNNLVGIGDYFETLGIATGAENGFDFLDGKSSVIAFFKEFVAGFTQTTEISYSVPDLSALVVLAQVFNIIILIVSIVLFVTIACWFFYLREEDAIKTAAIVIAWIGIVYFAEGLFLSLALEAEWKKMIDETGGNAVFFGNMFSTLSYVPLILIIIFEVLFWVIYYNVKETADKLIEVDEEEVRIEEEKESNGTESRVFTSLREFKKLLDEGVLTEEEFLEQKNKILQGHK